MLHSENKSTKFQASQKKKKTVKKTPWYIKMNLLVVFDHEVFLRLITELIQSMYFTTLV